MSEPEDGPIKLVTVEQQFDQELQERIVEDLKTVLARAERGELESLYIAYETPDYDGINWCTTGTKHYTLTIGRLEILKHLIMRQGDQDG